MELGKRIAMIRKDHNLTQAGFAEKYSVTQQAVSNWENGKSFPDLETIVRISDDFGVSLDDLLKGDRKMVTEISNNAIQGKRYKAALYTFAILIVAVVSIVGSIVFRYVRTTEALKDKFASSITDNAFTETETPYGMEYERISNGVLYRILESRMGSITDDWDYYNKVLGAYYDTDRSVVITNTDGSSKEIPYHLYIRFFDYSGVIIEAYEDIDPKSKDKFRVYDSSSMIADCTMYLDGYADTEMSPVMQQIYDDNRDSIETIIEEGSRLWNDVYVLSKRN